MSTVLSPVPVPGANDPLRAAQIADGSGGSERWIALRPLCGALRLDHDQQLLELGRRSWAKIKILEDHGVTISERTMTMWLASLDENMVSAAVRPQLIAYQCEAANALDAYFNRRETVTAPPLNAIDAIRATLDQLEVTDRRATEALVTAKGAQADVDAIKGNTGWVQALGYCKMAGLPTHEGFLKELGRRAAYLARHNYGIDPVKSHHQRYGTANLLPPHVWAAAAKTMPPGQRP